MKIKKVSHKMFNNTENLLFYSFFLFFFSLYFCPSAFEAFKENTERGFFFSIAEKLFLQEQRTFPSLRSVFATGSAKWLPYVLTNTFLNHYHHPLWIYDRCERQRERVFWCSVNEKLREWKIIIKNTTRQKKCM